MRDVKKIAFCKNVRSFSGTNVPEPDPKPQEAEMSSNDLNNAYAYECERRKDDLRAAAESQRVHDLLGGKQNLHLPWLMAVIGLLAAILIVIRVF